MSAILAVISPCICMLPSHIDKSEVMGE